MERQLNLSLPLTRYSPALATLVVAIGIGAYWADTLKFQEDPAAEAENASRTVAWYVAHIAEAKAVNRTCFHSQEPESPQNSEDCQNALKALELAHVSRNYQN